MNNEFGKLFLKERDVFKNVYIYRYSDKRICIRRKEIVLKDIK